MSWQCTKWDVLSEVMVMPTARMQPSDSLKNLMHDSLTGDVVQLPLVLDQEIIQRVICTLKRNAAVRIDGTPQRHIRENLHSNAPRVYLVVVLLRLLRCDWFNHVFHLHGKITAKSPSNAAKSISAPTHVSPCPRRRWCKRVFIPLRSMIVIMAMLETVCGRCLGGVRVHVCSL